MNSSAYALNPRMDERKLIYIAGAAAAVYSVIRIFTYALFNPEYLIYRLVASFALVFLIVPMVLNIKRGSRVIDMIVPLAMIVAESVCVVYSKGDNTYFTFLVGVTSIVLVYLTRQTLMLFIFLSNLIMIFFIVVMRYPMLGEGFELSDYVVNILVYEFMNVTFYMICHMKHTRYAKYRDDSVTIGLLMDKIPTHLALTDDNGMITYISGELLASLDKDEIHRTIGRPISALTTNIKLKEALTNIGPADGYVEDNFEVRIHGRKRWLFMRSSPLNPNTNARLYEWVDVTDLTDARIRAESADKAKSDFLARMSHEIRTPMNAIVGMSELILRKDIPRDLYEHAIGIKSASNNLLSIINDILDFSKLESGAYEINESEYHLASLMNDVTSIVRTRLSEKPVLFTTNIDSSLPSVLVGDEVRIRQVLLNLLTNAVKYTQHGHVSMKVTGEVSDGMVVLTAKVKDTGIGIKEEDLGKLFSDFMQLDVKRNKDVEGTGLGLVISRKLINQMGGDITVTSEYGKGSTFTIKCPQKIKDTQPLASVSSSERVLLYDTRQAYLDSLMYSLNDLGIQYKYVDNISELLDNIWDYDHIFAPSYLYDRLSPIIKGINPQPKLTLLTDISDTIAVRDARTLIMPAYSLTIANIFNNVQDDITYIMQGVGFIAPEAKVLVVDDITANLKVMEGLLSPYELQITTCKRGTEAVGLVSSQQFDLVFMDHMMPEMDGIEATQLIRANEGDYYANLPIIALTANALAGVKEMYLEAGMNDFLAKPIETVKLNAMLDKWIPRQKRRKPGQGASSNASESIMEILSSISELSVEKALSVVNGSRESYERNVKLAVRLLPENVEALNARLNEDISLYGIEVHGVKGVLYNIGAYALAETAGQLEALALEKKEMACRELHPTFIKSLERLLQKAAPILDEPGWRAKEESSPEHIHNIMPDIHRAHEYFDSALALETLDKLASMSFGEDLDGLLKELYASFERFDFDNAGQLLDKLKGVIAV